MHKYLLRKYIILQYSQNADSLKMKNVKRSKGC